MAPDMEFMTPTEPYDPMKAYYSKGLRARYHLDELKLSTIEKPQTYADIRYETDKEKYLARAAARVRAGHLETEVPGGWPKVLEGPLVWTANDFKDETEFILQLSDADRAEIVSALAHFKEQELDGDEVDKENFPLPILGQRLDQACKDVYNGRGFVIVRGLDPDAFSAEDLAVIYLGVSSYIAERRGKQDQRGSMMMHVINRGTGAARNDKPFHTDTVCDVLGLLTRSCSAKGGRSILASSWTVYNELAATRPDLIHTLAKPDWPFDTYGRAPPYYKRALLYHHDGKVIVNFSRRLLTGSPREVRSKGIPGLNEAQAEALDAVHFIAQQHEIRTSMYKGDMRFINNMAILHRRETFEDDVETKRHLIRIWLQNDKMQWSLPEDLRLAWARVFDDDERESFWDIEPPRKDGILLRTAGSCD